MPASPQESLDGFYRFLWPTPENEPARFAILDRELGGRRSVESLREHAAERGAGSATVVLDAGCGTGRQACTPATELACRVVALGLLAHNLRLALRRTAAEAVAGSIRCVPGSLEALPPGDERVDLVWRGDMITLLPSVERALGECARVLTPGGTALIYGALATEPLGPEGAARLCAPMGVNPATLAPAAVAGAAAAPSRSKARR
jgi:ubiquinone/menaquinone biosynthesis C-methylase UbiE